MQNKKASKEEYIAQAKAYIVKGLDPYDSDHEQILEQIDIQMKDVKFQKQVMKGIKQELIIDQNLRRFRISKE